MRTTIPQDAIGCFNKKCIKKMYNWSCKENENTLRTWIFLINIEWETNN